MTSRFKRWLYALLDWFAEARRQRRRERHFRALRRKRVTFGAGMESPSERQRRTIKQQNTRWVP